MRTGKRARAHFFASDQRNLRALFEESLPRAKRLWGVTGYLTPAVFALLDLPLAEMDPDREIRLQVGQYKGSGAVPDLLKHADQLRLRDPEALSRMTQDDLIRDWRSSTAGVDFPAKERGALLRIAGLLHNGRLALRGWHGERFLHGKAYLIEREDGSRIAIIGSPNMTREGLGGHLEMMVVADDTTADGRALVDEIETTLSRLWNAKEAVGLDEVRVAQAITETAKAKPISAAEISTLSPADAVGAFVRSTGLYASGGDLEEYQKAFVAHAYRKHLEGGARLILADEVGLGKSFQMIVFLALAALHSNLPGLIISPPGIMRQTQDEALRLGVPIAFWNGASWVLGSRVWPAPSEEGGLGPGECPTIIGMISTGKVKVDDQDFERDILSRRYSAVALDEAHAARTNVKKWSPATQAFNTTKLYTFIEKIGVETQSLILATGTPMQLRKREVWDLLMLLRRGKTDYSVMGSDNSLWRTEGERTVELIGQPDLVRALPDADLLRLAIDPLEDEAAHTFEGSDPLRETYGLLGITRIRGSRIGYAQWHQIVAAPLDRELAVEKMRAVLDRETPYHHRLIRRTRAQLESRGKLRRIDVRLWGDSDGETIEGHPNQIEAAELVIDLLRSMRRRGAGAGSGLVQMSLLRRVFSSPHAGLISLNRRMQNTDLASEEIEEIPEEDRPAKVQSHTESLNDYEFDLAKRAAAKLRAATDEKFETLCRLLLAGPGRDGLDVPWIRHGCLIFSQFHDTAYWLARQIEERLREADQPTPVAYYGSSDRSGVFADGVWEGRDRDELKREITAGLYRIVVGTDAASEGLNLQTLGSEINYDLPWNPVRLTQRQGRIRRIGQQRTIVDIANFRYGDTVEDKVYEVLLRRIGAAGELLGQRFDDLLGEFADSIIDGEEGDFDPGELIKKIEEELEAAKQAPFDLGDQLISLNAESEACFILDARERRSILGRGWSGNSAIVEVDSVVAVEGSATVPEGPVSIRASRTSYAVSLLDLLRAGLLRAGEPIFFVWPGNEAEGVLLADGQIQVRGATFRTPSGAGKAVRKGVVPGWDYWAVQRDGQQVTVGDMRAGYIATRTILEAEDTKEIGPDEAGGPEDQDASAGVRDYAIKTVSSDAFGRSGADIGEELMRSGFFAFRPGERLVSHYRAGSKIALYEPSKGVFGWMELAGPAAEGAAPGVRLEDPARFSIVAPIARWGLINPAVPLDVVIRSRLEVIRGRSAWTWIIQGPNRLSESDYRLLTRDEGRGLPESTPPA